MKKGQVTIFIIIGIVILVAVGLILYLRSFEIRSNLQSEAERFTVPQQVQPVKNFIDSCLADVARRGVELLGSQGGFLTLQDAQPVNPILPFSDSLRLFNDDNAKVGYWFYETDNGIHTTQIPALDEIKNNLELYIEDNAIICFSDFSSFTNYDIASDNSFDAQVEIRDEAVIVKLLNDVNVNQADFNFNLEQHFANLNVGLGKAYNIAKQIMEKENQEFFLEEKTEDILVLYDEIPYSGIDLDCTTKTWNKFQVYNDLKILLRENIGSIKVANTDFSSQDGYFIWNNVLDKKYSNVNVDFVYSGSWPLKMEVAPSEGNILKGTRINKGGVSAALNLFCLNNYHFIYDLKFPVLITVFDADSFNGNGFNFQFGTHVIIDSNQPRKDNVNAINIDNTDKRFCQVRGNNVDVVVIDYDLYQLSNIEQTLSNVDISYKCFSQECSVGTTSKDASGISFLSQPFPICVGGKIVAEKEGYMGKEADLDTNAPGAVLMDLKEIYNIDVEVLADSQKISNGEEVILTFTQDGYEETIAYPESSKIDLVSGEYIVTAYLVKKGSFAIKGGLAEECIKIPRASLFGALGLNKEECFKTNLDDLNLNELVLANNKFEIFAPIFDLQQNKKLLINLQSEAIPTTYQELNEIYQEKEVIGNYQFV